MTRIIGGLARGRRLAVPAHGTRPTSDRAREGLFNSLRSELELTGARVLDLFAGSGAVGLEALSRGAADVVLVEQDQQACATIRANIAAVALPGAQVAQRAAIGFLSGPPPSEAFDLIFADPPYALGADVLAEVLRAAVAPALLAADGVLVVERRVTEAELTWPTGVTEVKRRRYGDGQLWYGRRERGWVQPAVN